MKLLLQRVKEASVEVNQETVGTVDRGLLVFIAFESGDDEPLIESLLSKALQYRIFPDENDKMNLNVQQIRGGVLLVSQFTLAAETKKGLRPNFTPAAPPEVSRLFFDHAIQFLKANHHPVASGVFGADMKVKLINDGPVTIWLES